MFTDLKFILRSLLKTPGFTVIVILTLALGIGATITIFSMVNSVLLRPLPYAQPEQLARIYTEFSVPGFRQERFGVSRAEYLDILQETKSWASIDAWMSTGANVAVGTRSERITASLVTGGLLASLGVSPAMGRLMTPQDDKPGANLVAIVSYGFWQRSLGADRAIVGRDILLNGRKHTIVGVMPEGFRFPAGVDVNEIWAPLQIDPANLGDRSGHMLSLLGRLKPGISLNQAQSEFDALVEHWGKTPIAHGFMPGRHILVTHAFHEEVVRGIRPALQMLFGAVCFLLLIAGVNVANLLLARAENSRREIAIRGALGAGHWRLARQFLAEGILLASAGAAVGLLLAEGGLRLLKFMAIADIPRSMEIVIDGRVVSLAVALAAATGLAAGLASLAHALKRNLHDVMKSAAASTTNAVGAQRFRQALIVAQLALALVLLTGTGLMLRASWKLQDVQAGFDPAGVVTMSVSLPDSVYSSEAARGFWAQLEGRLHAIPGLENAAFTTALPPVQPTALIGMKTEGFVPTNEEQARTTDFLQVVSPRYFDTLLIRPVQGRLFDARDDMAAPAVAIVNQTMAQQFFKNGDAIGRRLRLYPFGDADAYTVIGVVADVKNYGVDKPPGVALYLPYEQAASHNWIVKDFYQRSMFIAVRTSGDPAPVVSAVRREVSRIDPSLPLSLVRTMDEVMSQTLARPRFLTLALTLFAGIALTLAAVGIYGVISYSVTQRTREFGIRMALGAQHRAVLAQVLKRGLLLTIGGVAIGLVGAFALTRFLSGFLFGVTPTDPVTFVAVSLLLSVIAVLASYVPARRATHVDPLTALRAE